MYKKLYIPITSFLLVLIAGCVPYSDTPLTDPHKEPMDTALYGTWFWRDGNETGYVHIGLDKESMLARVIMIELDGEGKLEVSEFTGHSSSVGHNKYLNLKWVRPSSKTSGYMFVKYQVEGDSLGVSLSASEVFERAVRNGSLKGTVEKDKTFSTVHITEEQGKLQQFIRENDGELYKEIYYLHRFYLPNLSVQRTR